MGNIKVTGIEVTGMTENQTPRSWFEKEEILNAWAVAFVDGKLRTPVAVTWYMGRSRSASVVYCVVSICAMNMHTHGHGQAGGYGYDKTSAALADALTSARVTLSESIHGTGQSREAIEAIAEYIYPDADDIDVLGV